MKKIEIIVIVVLSTVFFPCFLSFGTNENDVRGVNQFFVEIVREIPHHIDSFTQGFVFYRDKFYESTGLIGKSSLRKIDAHTGMVEEIVSVAGVFAEGLARWENRLVQLTWNDRIAFIYDMHDLEKVGTFSYDTEGWGLTADNHHLIMSDGSDKIYFRNPHSFEVERFINVRLQEKPIHFINELEFVDGLIYANIWREKFIVQIDPVDGTVVGLIDCEALFKRLLLINVEDVLNGIAFNEQKKTFYLTGKNWPKIFEVTLVPEIISPHPGLPRRERE